MFLTYSMMLFSSHEAGHQNPPFICCLPHFRARFGPACPKVCPPLLQAIWNEPFSHLNKSVGEKQSLQKSSHRWRILFQVWLLCYGQCFQFLPPLNSPHSVEPWSRTASVDSVLLVKASSVDDRRPSHFPLHIIRAIHHQFALEEQPAKYICLEQWIFQPTVIVVPAQNDKYARNLWPRSSADRPHRFCPPRSRGQTLEMCRRDTCYVLVLRTRWTRRAMEPKR